MRSFKDLNRHTYIYIDMRHYQQASSSLVLSSTQKEAVLQWFGASQPAIIRTPCFDKTKKKVFCGICFPASKGKLKLPLELDISFVNNTALPPLLSECVDELCETRKSTLMSFANNAPVEVRIVGSMAWQYLTKMQYMNEKSDIDMVFYLKDKNVFNSLDDYIQKWIDHFPCSVDIEIITPEGIGFLWKEFHKHPSKLLVKYPSGPRLIQLNELRLLVST